MKWIIFLLIIHPFADYGYLYYKHISLWFYGLIISVLVLGATAFLAGINECICFENPSLSSPHRTAAQSGVLDRTISKVLKKQKPDKKVSWSHRAFTSKRINNSKWQYGAELNWPRLRVLSFCSTMATPPARWLPATIRWSWQSSITMASRWRPSLWTRAKRVGSCSTWKPTWCHTCTGTAC